MNDVQCAGALENPGSHGRIENKVRNGGVKGKKREDIRHTVKAQ
jgi:hypothetical protein